MKALGGARLSCVSGRPSVTERGIPLAMFQSEHNASSESTGNVLRSVSRSKT